MSEGRASAILNNQGLPHVCSPLVRKVAGRGERQVSAGLWEAEHRLVCGQGSWNVQQTPELP